MIEPNYTEKPSHEQIAIDGRVLIFGSGKLTHEDLFFDFSNATEILCFDPLYKEAHKAPVGRGDKWSFFSKLSDATSGGPFDHVIALFSLHYEPAWINTLTLLLRALKTDGMFYFAEDRGFRAVLDGTEQDTAVHSTALHVHNVFNQRHHPHSEGEPNGTPWLPGIRASDYKQLMTLLSVFGLPKEAEPLSAIFQRKPGAEALQDEARDYLPWKSGRDLLQRTELGNTVQETVVLHLYRHLGGADLPETILSDSSQAETIRSIVFKDAANAIGQLDLLLPSSSSSDEGLDLVYSRLISFGRGWLSVLYQHIVRQVPEIEAVQLIFQRVGDHAEMAEALTSYEFEKDKEVFLTCTESGCALEPWDYRLTSRYEDYRDDLQKRELGFLAEKIFESGTSGVYWDGVTESMVGDQVRIGNGAEFADRSVPFPCLYIPARLAHIGRDEALGAKPVTLIAMIVYFREGSASKIDDSEWRNLHSLLLPLLDGVSARIALGEMLAGHQHKRLLKERERSHEMLLRLQRPLDALSNAFGSVQAEAQEMQAILNDPEEGVFKAHRMLAPIFHEGYPIQISKYLQLTPRHEHTVGALSLEELQQTYCYALACILGVQNELEVAPSHAALVELTRSALRTKRESGVYAELFQLLKVLCGLGELTNRKGSRVEIDESLQACWASSGEEKEADRKERYFEAIRRLKRVAFTPFKAFGHEWPLEPVQVAAVTKEVMNGVVKLEAVVPHSMSPQDTPFPQHAILTFIVGVKTEVRRRSKDQEPIRSLEARQLASSDGALAKPLEEYRLSLKVMFFGKDVGDGIDGQLLTEQQSVLHDCVRSTIRHGIVGRITGGFHGVFQDLLRLGLNLATTDRYSKGEWVLLEPPDPTEERAILLVLGKAKEHRSEGSDLGMLCNSEDLVDRYFAIVQEKRSGSDGHVLRILWSDSKARVIAPLSQEDGAYGAEEGVNEPASGEAAPMEAPPDQAGQEKKDGGGEGASSPTGDSDWPRVVCIDHDGQWFDELKQVGFLTVDRHGFSKVQDHLPASPCVVVLHGNPSGTRHSASSWKPRLAALIGEGKVTRVIVVSAGGCPSEKGIAEGEGFFLGWSNGQPIRLEDLLDESSRNRECFLKLLRGKGPS